ncbi:MAG TPA: imidazolonepropionase [Candidatus Nanopelagicaceae bacterium]|nr:imidazolonepropionase [Candidatus Nanopelagicaceae bacterium]HVC23638.1 imidazolonepropionase [Candidatus Dormibacteraeota bacterium]
MSTLLTNVGRLFTAGQPVLEHADVVIEEGSIAAVGKTGSLPVPPGAEPYDCLGGLLTAGLIDAHTHPIYPRPRLAEIAQRASGAPYQQIAAAGGGIAATVAETRGAPWDELERGLRTRLERWLEAGTTTVEAKTGYWLEREGELAAVRLLRRLADDPRLPSLVVTFLGAHDLPLEFAGERSDFVREVAGWAPDARREGARFADVFCDAGAFTVAESEHILGQARTAGLALRIHADELALTGGTLLAAQLGAVSADHLLCIGATEIAALAASSTVATLCPVTAVALGRKPPARALLDAGVPLALGSDHNPGTSGTTSMSLVVWLAITELGLSVEEGLAAATLGGSRSLGVPDRGQIAPGFLADLVLWEAEHEGAFAWNPGLHPLQVWRTGRATSTIPEGLSRGDPRLR